MIEGYHHDVKTGRGISNEMQTSSTRTMQRIVPHSQPSTLSGTCTRISYSDVHFVAPTEV